MTRRTLMARAYAAAATGAMAARMGAAGRRPRRCRRLTDAVAPAPAAALGDLRAGGLRRAARAACCELGFGSGAEPAADAARRTRRGRRGGARRRRLGGSRPRRRAARPGAGAARRGLDGQRLAARCDDVVRRGRWRRSRCARCPDAASAPGRRCARVLRPGGACTSLEHGLGARPPAWLAWQHAPRRHAGSARRRRASLHADDVPRPRGGRRARGDRARPRYLAGSADRAPSERTPTLGVARRPLRSPRPPAGAAQAALRLSCCTAPP